MECEKVLTFINTSLAFQFACRFRTDYLAMAKFRAVARGFGPPLSDDELLRDIATKLRLGDLRVCERVPEGHAGGAQDDPRAPAFDPSERRQYEAPPPPRRPKDEDSFEDADLIAIADAQKAAAEAGVPFCEECARAEAEAAGN